MPSRLVASQATGLLKSEAQPQLVQTKSEEFPLVFDRSLLQKLFAAVAAFMIAASAYAYMV